MDRVVSILQTARCLLAEAVDGDACPLERLMNSPDWLKYIGDRNIRSQQDAMNYIRDNLRAHYKTHGLGLYTVRLNSGAFVGLAGFVKREHLPHPDLGIAFFSEFYGRGLAVEVCESLLHYATFDLKLEKLLAVTLPTNLRARTLVERLGFVEKELFESPKGDTLMKYELEL